MQRFTRWIAMAAITLGQGLAIPAPADAPSPAQTAFIYTAAQAGLMEVEAATLAVSRARHAAVKGFAYRILYDYERINDELARIAAKRGVTAPAGLDAGHAQRLQSLRDAAPQDFDAAYLAAMIRERGKLVELLQSNLVNPDSELTVFSSYNLARIKEHRRYAEELSATLLRQ
jgi:putative membrane protein